ncbi:DNA-formamidopyrimidine glycosylase family protein [Solicola gregarius]|uniref:DNA-(apurinic or apyrimidinic site) lyase n=1 Tax=Solicola gregarius TaxID=2908642 RepID=A0AA46TG58_9ACTN|nr:DNA-formamidopyrimidine glycosylase family protein [Solicola gregarius]UYM04535.1 Fpg/Nei family DNA glycosylase [Solicola gregarius]
MPEGDAVWRTAKRLNDAFADTALTECDLRVPRYATLDLSGETVSEVVSRGKHLLMRIGINTLHSHLKMEGAWQIYARGSRWRRPWHQARAVLSNERWQAVGFSLGALDVVPIEQERSLVGHLGPDLLGADWDPDRAVTNLRADPGRAIGLALLDQTNLAGIGNIYRSEVCFVRGVDPRRATGAVADLGRLVEVASTMLRANLDHAAIVTTGNLRRGQQTWAYGRAGEPCRRCRTTIVRDYLGDGPDTERSIYVCPSCQT